MGCCEEQGVKKWPGGRSSPQAWAATWPQVREAGCAHTCGGGGGCRMGHLGRWESVLSFCRGIVGLVVGTLVPTPFLSEW